MDRCLGRAMPRCPTNLNNARERDCRACRRCGMGLFGYFFLALVVSSSSLSLEDGPIHTEILSQRAVKPQNNQLN